MTKLLKGQRVEVIDRDVMGGYAHQCDFGVIEDLGEDLVGVRFDDDSYAGFLHVSVRPVPVLLPESEFDRGPKAGEVWAVFEVPHFVVRDLQSGKLRLCCLDATGGDKGLLYAGFEDGKALSNSKFLAESAEAYYRCKP